MTTKSPAEAYSQQAEAISNQGKPMRWLDTAARLAPLVGLGALGYAERRRDARDAQEFHDRLERNYARIDAVEAARAAAHAIAHAIGADVSSNMQYHNDKDSYFVMNKMQMNSVLIDAEGVFKMQLKK